MQYELLTQKLNKMTTIEKIEKGIITLAEFTGDQQSFIKGIVKISFNEGQEQALRIPNVVGQSKQLPNDNLHKPCDGCTDLCENWEIFFCKIK